MRVAWIRSNPRAACSIPSLRRATQFTSAELDLFHFSALENGNSHQISSRHWRWELRGASSSTTMTSIVKSHGCTHAGSHSLPSEVIANGLHKPLDLAPSPRLLTYPPRLDSHIPSTCSQNSSPPLLQLQPLLLSLVKYSNQLALLRSLALPIMAASLQPRMGPSSR